MGSNLQLRNKCRTPKTMGHGNTNITFIDEGYIFFVRKNQGSKINNINLHGILKKNRLVAIYVQITNTISTNQNLQALNSNAQTMDVAHVTVPTNQM